MKRMHNPFELPGRWYKANLHVHTTTSDGALSPAERAAQYREAGYGVLALTDHSKTNDVRALSDRRLLVVSGMEYHPLCRTSFLGYHLVALNVPHGFRHTGKELARANRCIAKVKRVGGLTILAHTCWQGHGYSDFSSLRGLEAFEIYNAGCEYNGRGCAENEWVYAMDHGMLLPIVGSDDAHRRLGDGALECWSWLKLPSLTVASVLKAVRTGAGYVSCGPQIHYFGLRNGKLQLRCSPAAIIQFMSGPTMGVIRRAEPGQTITRWSIDVPGKPWGDRPWDFARAVVTDSTGRKAWTNPIRL